VIAMSTQLPHLAQAYFHQDYDLEFSSPDEAVEAFVAGEGKAAVEELLSEIEAMLASMPDEAEMAHIWTRDLGATYDPVATGATYRGWFEHVRDLLKDR
jgi:CdiI immunity protein